MSEFDVVHTHSIYLWPLWAAAREAQQAAAFGFDLPVVSVIPNGVAIERATGGISEGIHLIANSEPFALYLGRVNWKKGLDRLIRSWPHAGQLRLVIAGNDEEEYSLELDDLAQQAGVRDRVIFTGPVHGADKAVLLAAAKVLVLPSYSENFGNVIVEAMAAGCPVVVTPEVGIAQSVAQIGAGLVVDGSPAALGSAIAALAADEGRRREMGARGRAAAVSQFSWAAVAAQMEQLYQSLLVRRTIHA